MVVRGHEARRGGSPGCHSDAYAGAGVHFSAPVGLSRPRGGFRILGRLGLRSWRRRHGSDRLYARARRGTQGNHWLKSALIQNSRIELTRRRKTVSE
jgi:hypothetical protein